MGREAAMSAGYRSFLVREQLEVYDEPTARALAAVLDHLKLLIAVAGDTATPEQLARSMCIPRDTQDAQNPDLDRLTDVLLRAGHGLLDRLVELAASSHDPDWQRHILTAMLTIVPSLDSSAT